MSSRRRFLLLSGVAAGTLALVGGGGAVLLYVDRFDSWIRDALRRSLPGYDLEPNGLAQFIEEYYEKRKDNGRLRLLAATHGLVDARWAFSREMANDVDEEERNIVSDFLIGSDFFANYSNGTKEINYRGAPESCSSPFATF